MKKLIVLSLLLLATLAYAQQPPLVVCLTNVIVTINDASTSWINITGDPEYDPSENQSNVSGMALLAQNCDEGTTIKFSIYGCSNQDTQIGMVSYQCTPAWCGLGYCAEGNAWPVTMPAGCCSIIFRIVQSGCCWVTKCDNIAITRCGVSGD